MEPAERRAANNSGTLTGGRRHYGTIAVIGGGCYGSYYLRQLRRASAAGKVDFDRLLVVDRAAGCAAALTLAQEPDRRVEVVVDAWEAFLARWLDAALRDRGESGRDAIVPSPLMPHLLFEWLADRARQLVGADGLHIETPDEIAGVPWQRAGADGTRYVSFATWTCPINCIEPARCPHTKGPRDWSLHRSLADGLPSETVALLRVTHRVYGVGMIDVADVMSAHDAVTTMATRGGTVRVATASHCHGAVGSLRRA